MATPSALAQAPRPASTPDIDPAFAVRLLASLRSGLVAVDAEERVVAFSTEAARILGAPRREEAAGEAREDTGQVAASLVGLPAAVALAGQPRVRALLREALRGRELPSRAELVLDAEDGEPRTVGFTLVPVRDAGAMRGAAMLFRDLTPYERMDEQERLRDRLAALGQMAAGLAHEIRNPLAAMELAAGLLKRRLGDRPEERELVEEVLAEVRRLATTVTASLDFVRPPVLRDGPLDPAELLRDALRRARARVAFDGVCEVELPPRLPPLRGDAEQLRTVLVNLVVNALQAMARPPGDPEDAPDPEAAAPRPARLTLRARAAGGEVVLEVADTGPGVPESLRERIFYPFFTTRDEGSGVGLAEAQKIVASHGGVLDHAPAEGGGAVFRIHLPTPTGAEPGAGAPPEAVR